MSKNTQLKSFVRCAERALIFVVAQKHLGMRESGITFVGLENRKALGQSINKHGF